jgi:hypothetical protein
MVAIQELKAEKVDQKEVKVKKENQVELMDLQIMVLKQQHHKRKE